MGGMKSNGRDFGMGEGPDGPDFSDALYALFDLCWVLHPEAMDNDHGREVLARAQRVLDGWSDYLPHVPTEQEALEADQKERR
jgi:hypothetical protein